MKSKVTVQAFRDGEPVGEWVATSETKTVQQMVDWMFANAKEGIGLRFLGDGGFIDPSVCSSPSITESIPSRFTDPAYAKQERKVARVERSIRRNVR